MQKLRAIIAIDLVVSIVVLVVFTVLRLILEGSPPGILTITLIVLLILNIALCIYSLLNLKNGKNKLIQKIWLSYFALIAGFIIFDYIAGQIVLKDVSAFNQRDAILHHKLIPNTKSELNHILDYKTTIKINNIGCRGENITEGKSNQGSRILMLGDSFTMGRGVNDNETFSVILENKLNQETGTLAEVINCGVESYTPLLEYLQLKENIDFINPDIVILNFDMGDLLQEYSYRKLAKFDESGEIVAVSGVKESHDHKGPASLVKIKKWIYKNMLIGSNVLELLYKNSFKSKIITFENVVRRPSKKTMMHTLKEFNDQHYEELLGYIKESMIKAKELCIARDCEYIISVYPRGHQINDREWVPGRYRFVPKGAQISDRTVVELEKFAQRNNILFLNTFPDFRAYKGERNLYYNYDAHWTQEGHKVMADSIKKFLYAHFKNTEYNKN